MKKLKKLLEDSDLDKVSSFWTPQQTLEIIVQPSNDKKSFRASIKTVDKKAYGTDPSHPKQFIASGKTVGDALIELGQKLKT